MGVDIAGKFFHVSHAQLRQLPIVDKPIFSLGHAPEGYVLRFEKAHRQKDDGMLEVAKILRMRKDIKLQRTDIAVVA